MTYDDLERSFRLADTSNEAIRLRLVAARKFTGKQQQEIADAVGIPKTTYHSQEARGAPSIQVCRYFYRAYGIDFNFLLYGDFANLHPDVRDQLADLVSAEGSK